MQLWHPCSELSAAVLMTHCVLLSVACAWVAGTGYSQIEGGVGWKGGDTHKSYFIFWQFLLEERSFWYLDGCFCILQMDDYNVTFCSFLGAFGRSFQMYF